VKLSEEGYIGDALVSSISFVVWHAIYNVIQGHLIVQVIEGLSFNFRQGQIRPHFVSINHVFKRGFTKLIKRITSINIHI
jgi:hypothetical protein